MSNCRYIIYQSLIDSCFYHDSYYDCIYEIIRLSLNTYTHNGDVIKDQEHCVLGEHSTAELYS